MDLLTVYADDLRIAGFSERTVYEYLRILRKVPGFTEEPTIAAARSYLAERRRAVSSGSVYGDGRALKNYSRWWGREHDLPDALAKLPYPKADQAPPGKLPDDDEVERVLRSLSGPDFVSRRAAAIITVLRDTGMRRSEVAKLALADIDHDRQRLTVREAKNGEGRHVPLSQAARRSINRYLIVRAQHARAGDPHLFIGERGALRSDSVGRMVRQAGEAIGAQISCHQFRRGLAHRWVKAGGADDLLMAIAGWRDHRMPGRYRAEARVELAFAQFAEIIDRPLPSESRFVVRDGQRMRAISR